MFYQPRAALRIMGNRRMRMDGRMIMEGKGKQIDKMADFYGKSGRGFKKNHDRQDRASWREEEEVNWKVK